MSKPNRKAVGQFTGLTAICAVMLGLLLGADDPSADQSNEAITQVASYESTLPEYTAAEDDFHVVRPGEHTQYNQRARLIRRGKKVYATHCAGCHGENGDGNGPGALRLQVKPRNFKVGVYKFRSTQQLQLPLEADLHRIITKGLPGVSMPAFPLMPEPDRVAVIEYIKTFYPAWDEKAPERQVVHVPRAPQDLHTKDRVMRGRVVYLAMQCGRCHGMDGAGTNASIGYVDDKDLGRIPPRNFTRGRFRGGDDPEDVYRTFHTGLAGAMPKFDDSLIVYANQQTVATQADVMYENEMETLKPWLDQFAATPADIFKMTDAQKREVVVRNSWDLVAYVLSLTKDPKPTAPPPAETDTADAGADEAASDSSDDEYGEDDGY